MGRASLFVRALWWRRGLAVAVVLVGVVTTAIAALGPLYSRAAAESTLADRLATTSSAETGLAFTSSADLSQPGAVRAALEMSPAPGSVRAYPDRIVGASVPVTARIGSRPPSSTSLTWRDGDCAHLIVLTGRCPSGPHEAIVDDNAFHAAPNWALGQTVTVTFGQSFERYGPLLDEITIVGTYRPVNTADPFWFGRPYFTAHDSAAALPNLLNTMFVAESELAILPAATPGQINADYPLDASRVRVATIDELSREVATIQSRYPAFGAPAGRPAMHTQLAQVLAKARADHRQVDVDTLLVIAELAILAWLALFGVVADAIGARADDVALAKVRGHRPRSVLLLAVGEPIALLVLALPFGGLLAFAVVHLLAGQVLVPGTPVLLSPAVAGAVAIAFAGGVVAALLAARTILTRPVLEQWRSATSSLARGRGARVVVALEVALVVLAVAGVIWLRSGAGPGRGSANAVSLLAPGLAMFAIAVVGVRLIPAAIRRRLRATAGTRRLALFLALAQISRRAAGLRLAALLAVAVGLASFAIAGETVAVGNRLARAQTELGAPEVATVQFQPQHDPQSVVAALDPVGRWAMAAATWLPDGAAPASGPVSIVGKVLALDPARLPAVGTDVRGQLSMPTISSAIAVAGAAPAPFTASRLRVRIDASSITGRAPLVGIRVRPAHQQPISIRVGELQLGAHDYEAPVDCMGGCSFAGLIWERQIDQSEDEAGTVVVTGIEADDGQDAKRDATQVPADLSAPGHWRGDSLGGDASSSLASVPAGLQVNFRSAGSSSAILAYADSPSRVPIVATPNATAGTGGGGAMLDYSGGAADFAIVKTVGVLPQVLDAGVVADLDYLRIQLPDFDNEATWSIWLGPHAPADAISRLRDAHLIVEQVQTVHHRAIVLGRQAPALALILLLVCAVAACVLAVGASAISYAASGRRRAFELAALGVVGVRARVLRRACVLEQVLLLGASLLIGLPAGVIVARLVMPAIPQFSDATPTVLRYTPAVGPVLLAAAVFSALVLLTAVLSGVVLARAANAARLREAP